MIRKVCLLLPPILTACMSNGKEATCAPGLDGGISTPPDCAAVLPRVVVPAKVLPVVFVKLFAALSSGTLVDKRASAKVPVEMLVALSADRFAPFPLKLVAETLPVNASFVPSSATLEDKRASARAPLEMLVALRLVRPEPFPVKEFPVFPKVFAPVNTLLAARVGTSVVSRFSVTLPVLPPPVRSVPAVTPVIVPLVGALNPSVTVLPLT